ncbi:GAF domain-containing protein [Methanolobus sp. ZRKC3]|uniref:sensor histidine kinase n=1 Tax=Methanolobus sp. ZRKC3 TaxID=3125786 RepID=UPI0032566566
MMGQSDTEIGMEIFGSSSFIVMSRKLEDDLPVVYVTDNIKQFGYSPEEFTSGSMNFGEIIHPDDLKIISKALSFLNPKITEFEQEYRIITKFGETRYVEEKAKIRRGENGDSYLDGIISDITERKSRDALGKQWKADISVFSAEVSLENVLTLLVTNAEMVRPDLKCAVMLLDNNKKRIFHVVAPSFPDIFKETLEGMPVENSTGSCITAMHLGERFIVEDIEKHPYWAKYRDFAKTVDINACWAEPIISSNGEVLGAFAMYFSKANSPKTACLQYLKANADIAAIEIQNRIVNETFRESEYKFKKIYNSINDLIFVSKLNGTLIDVNQVVVDSLGYSKEYILSVPPASIVPSKYVQRAAELIKLIEKNGKTIYEAAAIRKDGSVIPLEINARLIEYNGKKIILSVARDITERKKAENAKQLNTSRLEALAKLTEMTGASLSEITNFAREEAVRLTGSKLGYLAFTNADESVLIMHSWSKSAMTECGIKDRYFIYPIETTGLWGEAVRQRRSIITNDYQAPSSMKKGYPKDHIELTRHMNIPLFDGDNIVAVAGVGNKDEDYDESDVLQLTLLMQAMWKLVKRRQTVAAFSKYSTELSKANKELRSINRIKSDYIEDNFDIDDKSTFSECDALSDEALCLINDSQKEAMSALLRNSERIKRLSDTVFYQNLKALGKIKYSFEPLNVCSLISDVLLNLILLIDEKELELKKEVPRTLPFVKGDKEKLNDVILSLIDNAINFTPKGKSIGVKAYEDNNLIHIEIADMGPGIQKDLIPHLFHSFYQLEETSGQMYWAIESGLQMCKDTVDAHGGNIWVESELGKGTTVHINLPLWEKEAEN